MSTVTVKTAVERYDFEDYGTLEERGRYVKFEDYAALAAQRDALAAECASTQDYLRNGPVINKGGELLAAHQFAPATPATDAFLREARAQGVEVFSEQQRSYIGKPSKNDAASSYCSREALKFADHLRQGASL